MKFIFFVGLILVTILLSGCATQSTGFYVSVNDPTQSIELGNDGMYVLHLDRSYTGHYHISDNKVYLAYPMGYTVIMTIDGKNLIYSDDDVWVKA